MTKQELDKRDQMNRNLGFVCGIGIGAILMSVLMMWSGCLYFGCANAGL